MRIKLIECKVSTKIQREVLLDSLSYYVFVCVMIPDSWKNKSAFKTELYGKIDLLRIGIRRQGIQ